MGLKSASSPRFLNLFQADVYLTHKSSMKLEQGQNRKNLIFP